MTRDLLLVGRVARAHGNKGQVIVNPETDFPERRFREGQVLLVGPEEGPVPRIVRAVRFQQGRPVIALDGIETMNDADALAGTGLWVEAAGVEPLPGDTFYHHDLVGCTVVDAQGAAIGTVRAVEGPMARSRLVVDSPRGEVLIPLAAGIVDVDPGAKRIVVTPPEGLLELNARDRR
jgi:16S rRNA processing protein RimM